MDGCRAFLASVVSATGHKSGPYLVRCVHCAFTPLRTVVFWLVDDVRNANQHGRLSAARATMVQL